VVSFSLFFLSFSFFSFRLGPRSSSAFRFLVSAGVEDCCGACERLEVEQEGEKRKG